MSRLKERAAERERQRAEDLAQAERIGADFGLGELRTTARYRQARSGPICITGMLVAIAGLVAGITFGAADIRYTPAYAFSAGLDLAGEADRMLAGRLVPALTGAYEEGEPVMAGQWRIDQAGLTPGPRRRPRGADALV